MSKDRRVRSQAITMAYYSWFFLARCSANVFRNKVHSAPIPLIPNTRGVKVPCSTSNTLCRYCLFFSFSCSLKIVDVGLFWLLAEFTCVTRTSKNAVTPRDQNPPALMSSLASGLVLADPKLNLFNMKQLCLQTVLEWFFSFLILVQLETTKISADPFRNQCNRVGKFSNKHKGYALQNHVIQTIQIGHVMDCTTACLEHASCKSYNIQENPKLCELSDSTKSASSGDFVSRSGFSYYDSGDTVQPGPHCESSPCLNGGTCIETCSPRGYYCVCNTNLLKYKTGEHCETSFPDTCKKVKDLGLSSGDGEYYLYLQRPTCSVPARVYCVDMNLDTPAEYVTLPAGRSVNFGFNNRPTYGKDAHGKTAFDKIRLMLPKRQVIRADWRFAELVEGNVNRPYGTAGDCVYRSSYCGAYVPVGHTKADLTGTDFRFPATIPYTVGSWPACARKLVSPSMSSNQKIWSVKCGGYCGGCSIKILILSVDGC